MERVSLQPLTSASFKPPYATPVPCVTANSVADPSFNEANNKSVLLRRRFGNWKEFQGEQLPGFSRENSRTYSHYVILVL